MKKSGTRYLFLTGGVMSGIGKGVAAASIGATLMEHGYRINIMKIDPYLNVDAGTMHPTEHGETFVLENGLETDQDMGNYERFLHRNTKPEDYLTSGMVYKEVIDRERALGYAGKCVEAIPHVVEHIQKRIEASAKKSNAEMQIVEIGGTIGDYQNVLFFETVRKMRLEKGRENVITTLVTFFPYLESIGEVKTRPAQNSVRQMNSYGLNPDIIFARSKYALDKKRKEKLSKACNIPLRHIIPLPDVPNIYQVPTIMKKEKVSQLLMDLLNLNKRKVKNKTQHNWKALVKSMDAEKQETVTVAIAGKYFKTGKDTLKDSYISIIEAIKFSGAELNIKPEIHWINAQDFEKMKKGKSKDLDQYNAIIIPGGFGETGVNGKLNIIQHARETKIPTLGICYGMQLMVVEYMRNKVKKKDAHTTEVCPETKHPAIDIMEEQKQTLSKNLYGGTMRLGGYKTKLKKNSLLRNIYRQDYITERHRHRYELNNKYITALEKKGMYVTGFSKNKLAETIEVDQKNHPFFVGTQFHPEFTARPFTPNPIFTNLLKAAKDRKEEVQAEYNTTK